MNGRGSNSISGKRKGKVSKIPFCRLSGLEVRRARARPKDLDFEFLVKDCE